MNYEPLKHFHVEFTNFAPVSGKPLNANLLFDNRLVAAFPSLNKTITYNHQNYDLQSNAYDYDGALHQTLNELNDEIFSAFATERNPQKLEQLFFYLLKDNRFQIPVLIKDQTIANRIKLNKTNLQYLINDSVKAFNNK